MLITAKEARAFSTAPEPKTYALYIMEVIELALGNSNDSAQAFFSKEYTTVIGRGMSRKLTTIDPDAWKKWIEDLDYTVEYKEIEDITSGSSLDKRWEFTITWPEEKEEE